MSAGQWFPDKPSRGEAINRRLLKLYKPRLESLEDRFLPSTFSVLNTSDSGIGSLRQAIIDANNHPNDITGPDVIDFAITPSGGSFTIAPTSVLPTITDPVIIDGFSQNGASPGNLLIELAGINLYPQGPQNGLVVDAGGSTIKGLAIDQFPGSGIILESAGGNSVQGNQIGTDLTGTRFAGNVFGITITSSGNIIGGTTSASRNLISGNTNAGVSILGSLATGNQLQGNYIGTNVTATSGLGNDNVGVLISQGASANIVGGSDPSVSNVISGNGVFGGKNSRALPLGLQSFLGVGVQIEGTGTTNNTVQGNFIGSGPDGTTPIGNFTFGVFITDVAANNSIGAPTTIHPTQCHGFSSNTIAFNGGAGVLIGSDPSAGFTSLAGTGNQVLTNSIFANMGLAIDLGPDDGVTPNDQGDGDTGPNNLQNFPVLTAARSSASATVVQGSLNSIASVTYTIQFFGDSVPASGTSAQSKRFLGFTSVTTDSTGNINFTAVLPISVAEQQVVTATATDPGGNTSELAAGLAVAINPISVTSADAGTAPLVKVLDVVTKAVKFQFNAYDTAFTGGVRVAVGDVNSDGVPDIITVSGPGMAATVHVYDGVTGNQIMNFSVLAGFTGGAFVAVGDLNCDGFSDIVVGADAGTAPGAITVEAYSGKDGTRLMAFSPYAAVWSGGVRVAAGDINGDGAADIITAAGPGGGPHVRAFDGMTGAALSFQGHPELGNGGFYAYAPIWSGGVFVSAGDTTGTGRDDIVTSAGPGGGPHVIVFDGLTLAIQQYDNHPDLKFGFYAYNPTLQQGVRVSLVDVNGDGRADIYAAAGPGPAQQVMVFDAVTLNVLDSFFAFDSNFVNGVFVGAQR